MNKLRAGVIGLAEHQNVFLDVLVGHDDFHVQAVADRDIELAKRLAGEHEMIAYDDYRLMIVQEKLDALFLLVPTYQCGECIQLAAREGIHVFKNAPLARTVPEASEWIDKMAKAERRFLIGSPKRFAPSFLESRRLVQEGRLGDVYLVRGELFVPQQCDFAWRGDPVLAGGGVLMEMGYHLVDQIVWTLGAPERVYCLQTDWCRKKTLPPYKTEDTAGLTMTFPNGAVGTVSMSWMTGPAQDRLLYHGTEGSIEATPTRLKIFNDKGEMVLNESYPVDAAWLTKQEVRQFGDTILERNRGIPTVNTAEEHLINVSVIESAYLSVRTQLPETLKVYDSIYKSHE